MPHFRYEALIPFDVSRVYAFFATPRQMLRLVPPGVTVTVESAPEQAATGAELRLAVSAMGFSQKLKMLITEATPHARLADRQVEGPFKKWEQVHTFETDPSGGTRVLRSIEFLPPGGILGMFITEARVLEGLETLCRSQFEQVARLLSDA